MGKVMGCHFHNNVTKIVPSFASRLSLWLALRRQTVMLDRSIQKGTEGSLQPVASKESRPLVKQLLNNCIWPTICVSVAADPSTV